MGAILLILNSISKVSWFSRGMDSPLDSENENELGLLINEEAALLLAHTSKADLLTLGIAVLLDIGLGTLEDDATLLLVGLCLKVSFECNLETVENMNFSQHAQPRKMVNKSDNIDQKV